MELINIITLSLLPAIIYAFIIYITVPYKTINAKAGSFYLVGGLLSVVLLISFFKLVPSWGTISFEMFNPIVYPLEYLHAQNFIEIGFIEEFFKLSSFFIVDYIRRKVLKKKDHPLSTMFYVGAVSLGFAVLENVKYGVFSEDPTNTLIWRSFTAVVGHMIFGLIMGYWIALSRLEIVTKGRSLFDIFMVKYGLLRKVIYTMVGLGSATIVHGIYDLHLKLNGNEGLTTLYMLLIMCLLAVFWCFKNLVNSHRSKNK